MCRVCGGGVPRTTVCGTVPRSRRRARLRIEKERENALMYFV